MTQPYADTGTPINTLSERIALSNEWHARPLLTLPSPLRCSHMVCLRGDTSLEERRQDFADFCESQGQSGPSKESRHHSVNVGNCLLKWEGHTEADSYTLLVAGNGEPPFAAPAISFLDASMRSRLMDQLFLGVHIEVIPCTDSPEESRLQRVRALLGRQEVYGGSISDNQGEIWSSFRLDAEGFSRIVIMDCALSEARLSRQVQRILEVETYRMLAMLGLPAARDVMGTLGELEPALDEVIEQIAHRDADPALELSLGRITRIAAKVEHVAAAHAYRFAASRAYNGIVERRVAELSEQQQGSAPRYTTFLQKTLMPAMRTCEAAERRTQELAQRVTRATQLLDSMVDMDQKKQNQAILESLAERANLQLRLQQSVEGFSIFAITYYAVGLLGYLFKSAKSLGLGINPDLLTGITAPVVLAIVWLSVRSIKNRLKR
ncbi:DUF3422 family protein [Congregibacter litoralis]|uniref:Putative membrane-anchored protein conserved in bacteria n=1 Tax=Congregibacter litoralis KT71 TaxID=314285 RepID=A4ABJ6_9GAMM|nr:DUF3422 domain-containing protein [Congregibacter litoralis]EAQ96750.1 putative membrane-anchored protein conserved in bacteria [Congregibacter litoralis KT71]